MQWVLASLVGIGFVEILLRLPLSVVLKRFLIISSKAKRVIRSPKISDHWKERILPIYAIELFKITLRIALYLFLAMLPILLLLVLADAFGIPLWEFMLSLVGILFVTALSIGYATVRKKRV